MNDAPTPCLIDYTNESNETPKIKNENTFEIISDKNNYFIINISNYYNYILIKANLKKSDMNYEQLYYLNDLKNNKFLSLCDSIDDVYEQIIYELKKNSQKIIIEENKKIIIIIPVEHVKIKEIKFILPENNKTDKQLIKDLFIEINYLKNDNKNLNEEISELKNIINNLQSKNNFLEEKITNILNKLDYLEKTNNLGKTDNIEKSYILEKRNNLENTKNPDNIFIKSSIIMNDIKKQKAIIEWIEEKTKSNINKIKLIFKMTEYGNKSEDFHKFCDYKGPTLILIKTTKNIIFGGFTPLNWNKSGKYFYDKSNQTFIFSLNLMKKYNMKNIGREAIFCRESGPSFGCDDFRLCHNLKKGQAFANEFSNFLSNTLELIGGNGYEENFEVEEFEVFKVIY